MDIAKYIGLFLLKNHFCYIHGLGNLELRKKSATLDGEVLRAPSYEVAITQGGSIDDNLANFIATNEFISISKASNALREFSTNARAQLQEGKDVQLSNIGKFHEVNGKITFITDPNLQFAPHPIPTVRTERRQEEVVTPSKAYTPTSPSAFAPPEKPQTQAEKTGEHTPKVNWIKVSIAAAILIVIFAVGIFALKYLKNRNAANDENSGKPLHEVAPPPLSPEMIQQKADSLATVERNLDSVRNYNFVIEDQLTLKKGEKKVALMKSWKRDVELIKYDTTSPEKYLIILHSRCAPSDTLRYIDSMAKNYAYPAARIYH